MRVLTTREKTICTITVGIVVVSLGYALLVEPFMKQDSQLNAGIKLSQMELSKSLALIGRRDFLQGKYPELYSEFKSSGMSPKEATALMVELEKIAKGAGLSVLDIRPETSGERRKGREILLEMRAEGKIEIIYRFLYDFENSLSLLRVKRFSVNVKPHSEVLEARFSVVWSDAPATIAEARVSRRSQNALDRDL